VHGKLSKKEEFTVKYQITKDQQSNKLVTIAALASHPNPKNIQKINKPEELRKQEIVDITSCYVINSTILIIFS
jgi:hypothetical protein